VFQQAQDHLAVKVDIRDGQLRISDHATFKVYVLNSMDQTIEDIHLEVVTEDFETTVAPDPQWPFFPHLQKAKKQYFDVELRRKSGTEPGKYTIDLRLICNGRDLKTVNFDDALDLSVLVIPENSAAHTVDGNVSSSEWENSLLCNSLLRLKSVRKEGSSGTVMKNLPAEQQTRFRFSRYQETLYCLIDFMKDTGKDFAHIYVANGYESEPIVIITNLQEQKAFIKGSPELTIQTAVTGTKMELAVPLEILPFTEQALFYLNVIRIAGRRETYRRGGLDTYTEPVVYGKFRFQ
jgi:hypothetical protein